MHGVGKTDLQRAHPWVIEAALKDIVANLKSGAWRPDRGGIDGLLFGYQVVPDKKQTELPSGPFIGSGKAQEMLALATGDALVFYRETGMTRTTSLTINYADISAVTRVDLDLKNVGRPGLRITSRGMFGGGLEVVLGLELLRHGGAEVEAMTAERDRFGQQVWDHCPHLAGGA